MREPPHGTVTFLFTDIERSSEQYESRPRRMLAAVARHDAILRTGIEAGGGYVVKGRLAGDSFFAAFQDPAAAVTAACRIQRDLVAAEWPAGIVIRVRMGVHTGVAAMRDGDYFGDPVNRCSRIMESAHGGQTLVSAATTELACPGLDDDTMLVPLGFHQLPGLRHPIEIYQLNHPELPAIFPPLRTEMFPHNLPSQVTDFIGRERELSTVTGLITSRRLVTLMGPGGIGKTRLAMEAARSALTSFPAGVWLAELADTTHGHQVAQRLAHALSVRDEPDADILDSLKRYLARGRRLVVLDNCEQVLEAVAALVTELLPACPDLGIMATSRADLGIAGETVFAVPPLSLPGPDATTVESVCDADAVRLLEARASTTGLPFAVTSRNAADVAELVRRLDGFPLAIELAAARIGPLSVGQVLERIAGRLDLLASSNAATHRRLKSVTATIEWSHELLPEAERSVFRRLAVFAGGFDLGAAETVTAFDDRVVKAAVADMVSVLAHQSLLWVEAPADGTAPRYRLPETVRTFARQCLRTSGEEQAVAERHLAYFLALAESAEPELVRSQAIDWLGRLEVESDNLAAAFDWAEAQVDDIAALRLVSAQWRLWHTRGHHRAGLDLAQRALSLPVGGPEAGPLRAKVLHVHGTLCFFVSDFESARASLTEALALRRELGDGLGMAQTLNNLAMVAQMTQDMSTARDMYLESYEMKKGLGDHVGMVNSMLNVANIEIVTGRPAEALRLLAGCVAACREHGLQPLLAQAHLMQIHALNVNGELGANETILAEATAQYEALGDALGLAEIQRYRGLRLLALGDLDGAECHLRDSLARYEQAQTSAWIATLRTDLAWLAILRGDVSRSVAWLDDAVLSPAALEDHEIRSYSLMVRGLVACEQGFFEAARDHLASALSIQHGGGYRHLALDTLEAFAWLAARRGDAATASALARATANENRHRGRKRPAAVSERLAAVLATAGAAVGPSLDGASEAPPPLFEDAVAMAFSWGHDATPAGSPPVAPAVGTPKGANADYGP